MKILWLSMDFRDTEFLKQKQFKHFHQSLLDWLQKKAEVVCYSHPLSFCGSFNREGDVQKIVKKEKPDAIFIITAQGKKWNWKNLDKINDVLKIVRYTDFYGHLDYQIKFVNENKIDVMLVSEVITPYYKSRAKNTRVIPFPNYADTDYFKPLGLKRIYDVSCIGNFNRRIHPVRYLGRSCDYGKGIRTFFSSGHKLNGRTEYVRLLNQSKMTIFDGGHLKIPLKGQGDSKANRAKGRLVISGAWKWSESLACKTLCLAEHPTCVETLTYRPYFNYVPVTRNISCNELIRLVKYYKENVKARTKIVENGYKTFLKYHTTEKRVDSILKIISEGKV